MQTLKSVNKAMHSDALIIYKKQEKKIALSKPDVLRCLYKRTGRMKGSGVVFCGEYITATFTKSNVRTSIIDVNHYYSLQLYCSISITNIANY